MFKTEDSFPTFDGLRLFCRRLPARRQEKAILIFVHGLNEHSGRYGYPFAHFADDFTIYAFDFRGHGRSEGVRSYVESFDDLVNDLKSFVQHVLTDEKGKKVFLIGHSMGGQVVLNHLGQSGGVGLAGFLTSSPNVLIAFSLNRVERFLGRMADRIWPTVWIPNKIKPEQLSHVPEVVAAFKSDPLINKTLRARLGAQIMRNQENVVMTLPQKITLPAFMMHSGDDHVCAKEGTEMFFEKLASKDKTKKIYPGAYHELFNETLRDEVFRDMQAWLEKRL